MTFARSCARGRAEPIAILPGFRSLTMTGARLATIIAAVAGAAAGLGFYLWQAPPESRAGGEPFAQAARPKAVPELRFQDAAGRELTLADFRGRMVLLNVWATWCPPCREEMPTLDRLQAKLGGPDFEVVALSVDQQGAEAVRKFFEETRVKALQRYIDPSAQAAFKLGAVGLPVTLLLNREGREIGRHVGPATWDAPEIVERLQRQISETRRR